VGGILTAGFKRQPPPQKRIHQPVFGDLKVYPSRLVLRHLQIGHRAVMPASEAVGRSIFDEPVQTSKAAFAQTECVPAIRSSADAIHSRDGR